ncbi:MAG: hypothetical protein ACRDBG_09870 [Waterburya sp.]
MNAEISNVTVWNEWENWCLRISDESGEYIAPETIPGRNANLTAGFVAFLYKERSELTKTEFRTSIVTWHDRAGKYPAIVVFEFSPKFNNSYWHQRYLDAIFAA